MAKKSPLLEKGKLINSRYEIVGEINDGASGQVFIVKDLSGLKQTKKALKIIPKNNEATQREIDILSRLNLADNIAQILDYGLIKLNNEISTYIVMDLYERGEITNLTSDADYQILSNEEMIYYLKQSLKGLRNLHTNKHPIVHKDVKPGNILLDKSKDLYFSDFGISMYENENRTSNKLNGTVRYMAPESRFMNEENEATSFGLDIFALGIIFYKFATGTMPQINYGIIKKDNKNEDKQIEKNMAILDNTIWESIPRPKQYNDLLNDDLDKIISKMIAKDYKKRYHNVSDILEDLALAEGYKKIKNGNVNINEIALSESYKSVEKRFYVYKFNKFINAFNWRWFFAISIIAIILVFIFVVVILLV